MGLFASVFEESHKIPMNRLSDYGKKDKILGRGTYGTVYKYVKGDELYAIKEMGTADDDIGDALREIAYMLRLNHPNVLNIIDVVVKTDKTFAVLPYAGKGTLADVDAHAPFLLKKNYAYQFLCGVAYCLSRNIIHCDIKPQNSLITDNDIVKIADFGIAHAFTCEGVYAATNVYTVWYRAPEVFLGGRYSEASDIWAAACTVFEIFRTTNFVALFETESSTDEATLSVIMTYFKDYENLWPGIKTLPAYGSLKIVPTERNFEDKCKRTGIDDPQLIEILVSMLKLDPSKRASIHTVLRHPFFDDVRKPRNETDEYTCEENLDMRSRYPGPSLIPSSHRRALFGWLAEVRDHFRVYHRTLCLAYYFVDLYTQSKNIDVRKEYQLIGVACFLIASNFRDIHPVDIGDMKFISKTAFDEAQFIEMFIEVIKLTRYDGLIATAADYHMIYRSVYPDSVKDTSTKLLEIIYFGDLPFHHHAKQLSLVCILMACSFFDLEFKHTSKLDKDAITIYHAMIKEVATPGGKKVLGGKFYTQFIKKLKTNPIKVL